MSAELDVLLRNASGLHARPAARLVEVARTFESGITIDANGISANAKSLIALLKLGLSGGATIHISAEGSDAHAAVARLVELLGEFEAEERRG